MIARSLGLKEKREEGDETRERERERESIVTISPSNNRTVCLPFGQTLSGSWKTLDGWRRTTTTSAASSEPLVGWYIIPAAKWVAGGSAVLSRGWRNNTDSFLAFRLESFKVRSALSAPPRPNQLLTQYEIALLTGRETVFEFKFLSSHVIPLPPTSLRTEFLSPLLSFT